ncbi:MAG: exodeoxyribonuclease VII small subunit [Patescibacteria group bacterium]|nr:exodeoxyribonuclease VII small subunit [Patescibacteria group bacterium]
MAQNKLKDSLKKLKEIIVWFDNQEEIDVETALEKVKQGVVLIKESRGQLKQLENEFEKVKQDIDEIA